MKIFTKTFVFIIIQLVAPAILVAQKTIQTDTYSTNKGELKIHFVGHGSLLFEYNGKAIHVDPSSREADYSKLPKADIILVTHHHGDHFDKNAIQQISGQGTSIIMNGKSAENAEELKGVIVMKNGDSKEIEGIHIDAVPAYNLVHMRSENNPYHPKGEGNGYVLNFGGKRVYIAGDTENTPEMKALKNIDIAFLPMNLPYTMTPEMVADAAKGFQPSILYPYHYGSTDPQVVVDMLKNEKGIQVIIRDMP